MNPRKPGKVEDKGPHTVKVGAGKKQPDAEAGAKKFSMKKPIPKKDGAKEEVKKEEKKSEEKK